MSFNTENMKYNDVGRHIVAFDGNFRFLSNFFPSPIRVGAVVYATAEHYYQAEKTNDPVWKHDIGQAVGPDRAKEYGRNAPLREDWEQVKIQVMGIVLRAKFDQNPILIERLLATKNAKLIEGNDWGDVYWGECPLGTGENNLGKLLMGLREWYRSQAE